jgi:phosphate acetyltransferase
MRKPSLLRKASAVGLDPAPATVVPPLSSASLHAVHGTYAVGLIAPTIMGWLRMGAHSAPR